MTSCHGFGEKAHQSYTLVCSVRSPPDRRIKLHRGTGIRHLPHDPFAHSSFSRSASAIPTSICNWTCHLQVPEL